MREQVIVFVKSHAASPPDEKAGHSGESDVIDAAKDMAGEAPGCSDASESCDNFNEEAEPSNNDQQRACDLCGLLFTEEADLSKHVSEDCFKKFNDDVRQKLLLLKLVELAHQLQKQPQPLPAASFQSPVPPGKPALSSPSFLQLFQSLLFTQSSSASTSVAPLASKNTSSAAASTDTRRGRPRHPVWTLFGRIDKHDALCNICGSRVRSACPTNLCRHLHNNHCSLARPLFEEWKKQKELSGSYPPLPRATDSPSTSSSSHNHRSRVPTYSSLLPRRQIPPPFLPLLASFNETAPSSSNAANRISSGFAPVFGRFPLLLHGLNTAPAADTQQEPEDLSVHGRRDKISPSSTEQNGVIRFEPPASPGISSDKRSKELHRKKSETLAKEAAKILSPESPRLSSARASTEPPLGVTCRRRPAIDRATVLASNSARERVEPREAGQDETSETSHCLNENGLQAGGEGGEAPSSIPLVQQTKLDSFILQLASKKDQREKPFEETTRPLRPVSYPPMLCAMDSTGSSQKPGLYREQVTTATQRQISYHEIQLHAANEAAMADFAASIGAQEVDQSGRIPQKWRESATMANGVVDIVNNQGASASTANFSLGDPRQWSSAYHELSRMPMGFEIPTMSTNDAFGASGSLTHIGVRQDVRSPGRWTIGLEGLQRTIKSEIPEEKQDHFSQLEPETAVRASSASQLAGAEFEGLKQETVKSACATNMTKHLERHHQDFHKELTNTINQSRQPKPLPPPNCSLPPSSSSVSAAKSSFVTLSPLTTSQTNPLPGCDLTISKSEMATSLNRLEASQHMQSQLHQLSVSSPHIQIPSAAPHFSMLPDEAAATGHGLFTTLGPNGEHVFKEQSNLQRDDILLMQRPDGSSSYNSFGEVYPHLVSNSFKIEPNVWQNTSWPSANVAVGYDATWTHAAVPTALLHNEQSASGMLFEHEQWQSSASMSQASVIQGLASIPRELCVAGGGPQQRTPPSMDHLSGGTNSSPSSSSSTSSSKQKSTMKCDPLRLAALPEHKNAKRNRKTEHPVWEYFKRDNNGQALCVLCKATVKSPCSSNFMRHLLRHHKQEHIKVFDIWNQKRSNQPQKK